MKIEKRDLCNSTPTTFIISPIIINEYPEANVLAPLSACTGSPVLIQDISSSGAHFINNQTSCNTTISGVWIISPGFISVNTGSLGTRYKTNLLTGAQTHHPINPTQWTTGSQNINVTFNRAGTYNIKRVIGRFGSSASCNIDSIEVSICVDTIQVAEILVDSIPRFICDNDVVSARIKLDSVNCSEATNYSLSIFPLTGNQPIASYSPLPNTNKFEPDFSGLGGTYRLRYSASNGCGTSYDWDTVTIRAIPDFGFSTPSVAYCSALPFNVSFGSGDHEITGNSLASAPNTPSYSIATSTGWSQVSSTNGIPVISFTSYGTYTITFTYTGLCGTDTAVQTIQLTPLPVANFQGLSSGCGPLTNTLYSTSSAGFGKTITNYLWSITPTTGA